MHIKPRSLLTARELPFAESPDLGFRLFKQASLLPEFRSVRFNWNDISGFNSYTPPKVLRSRLLSGLASGKLVLVHDALTSERPQAPLAMWEPDFAVASGGKWVPGITHSPFAGLVDQIERLNREGVTPQSIGISTPGAASLPIAKKTVDTNSSLEIEPQDHKLSLPLAASAGVAPLSKAWDLSSEKKSDDGAWVDLTIGIFTDGTLNNFENIKEFRDRVEKECLIPSRGRSEELKDCRARLGLLLGESYANEPTNIVKLFSVYADGEKVQRDAKKIFIKIYEPGVGTRSGEDDSVWGMATGLGETGLQAQVRKAFEQVASRIRAKVDLANVRKVEFDLFGFSRGAAAARYAANEILNGPGGLLGEAFREEGLTWPNQVSVRFMGLFDTVAGIVNPSRLDFSAGNNRNKPVNINLASDGIGAAVHLVALDECRTNFSLNSLCDSRGNSPGHFREIALPGAHSDIGGGYPDSQVEDLLLYPTLTLTGRDSKRPKDTLEWDNLRTIQQSETAAGWIGEHSLPLDDGSKPNTRIDVAYDQHPLPDGRVELQLKSTRKVKGEFSRIPLLLLHKLARKEGVPLMPISEKNNAKVPSELTSIFEELSEKVLAGENYPALEKSQRSYLKQRYIHHSHHFNLFKLIAWDEVAQFESPFRALQPSRPAGSNRRTVHWNRFED